MKIEEAIFEVSNIGKYYVRDLKHTRAGEGEEHLVQVGVKGVINSTWAQNGKIIQMY